LNRLSAAYPLIRLSAYPLFAGLTRSEAVEFGERWIELGLVRHVLDEHDFRDGRFYAATAGASTVTDLPRSLRRG
jgi:hypothetical protein